MYFSSDSYLHNRKDGKSKARDNFVLFSDPLTSPSPQNYETYYRKDTVKLCKILSSWNLETDNSFLYLLSFPSLIESQTKVKQHKGFFVRNTYPNTLCKGMLEQLITLRGQLDVDSKCSPFEPGGHSSLRRLIHFWLMWTVITDIFLLFHLSEESEINHVHVWKWSKI